MITADRLFAWECMLASCADRFGELAQGAAQGSTEQLHLMSEARQCADAAVVLRAEANELERAEWAEIAATPPDYSSDGGDHATVH